MNIIINNYFISCLKSLMKNIIKMILNITILKSTKYNRTYKMTTNKVNDIFFAYSWHVNPKETEITSIRVYGLDKNDESVCVRIDDFEPYVYLELPPHINWDDDSLVKLGNKLNFMLGDKAPITKSFAMKKRLYYSNLDSKGERKRFPYLVINFSNKADIRFLTYKLKSNIIIAGIGAIQLKIHEQDASEILQLVSYKNLPTAGWIKLNRATKVHEDEQITSCDKEYMISWKSLEPVTNLNTVPKPVIMSFDIEVNSSDPCTFPDAERYKDKVFQISCVTGKNHSNTVKCILSLGEPDQKITGKDIEIRSFDTEDELLLGFTDYVNEIKPNIIIGYNIFGFDIPYMIKRAVSPCMCYRDFAKMGFLIGVEAEKKSIKWSSSAYGTQEFDLLDLEGRIFIDLLPLVQRDYKMSTYTLKSISSYFIGDTKDDVSPKGIFKCYRIGTKRQEDGTYSYNSRKAMGLVAKYAIQDADLVYRLIEKLQTWIGLIEMAKVCNVPIIVLYTQGQQIKVYSQVYKRCMRDGYVVEKDGYKVGENEHYVGAHVFDPIPGLYEDVIPFDFTSLYPTTIIANNICWSTLVKEEHIKDSDCHIFEWEDHQGCIHDKTVRKSRPKHIMCTPRYYRFLKEPIGILPKMLTDLLDARKKTKNEMKDNYKKLKQLKDLLKDGEHSNEEIEKLKTEIYDSETFNTVLDKRQLAFKVSANSAYGALGVQRGYLPLMPGAMCTTARGRESIEKVAEFIPRVFGGKLIYGDTDSNYISFPNMKDKTVAELWEFAEMVAEEASKLFPKPMKLEFEEKIYRKFFIITKKRYMSISCSSKDGVLDEEINKKGVILARRDNSKVVRDIYEENMMKVFNLENEDDVLYDIVQKLNKICCGGVSHDDFVITKSVKDTNNIQLDNVIEEPVLTKAGTQKLDKNGNAMSKKSGMIGEYKIPLWRNDEEKKQKLKLKNAISEKDYYIKCLPAQVQLAERMKSRGKPVSHGTRLEYVIITDGSVFGSTKAKQYEKIESVEYYKDHSEVLKIDYLYYIEAISKSLDQVLNVVHKNKNFTFNQFKYRLQKLKVQEELLKYFNPEIVFK